MGVTLIERFYLSEQYTPENFMEVYRSSMELELKNYNMLEYNLFKRAQITFPEAETMQLQLPDSVIAREKSEILLEYFHKVFCERCGMNLKADIDFIETGESKYRKNAALQIQQEVENVLRHAKLDDEKTKSESQEKKQTADSGQEKAASGETTKGKAVQAPKEKKPFEKKVNGATVEAIARIQIRMLSMEGMWRMILFLWNPLWKLWAR